uniref:Thioredoxin domain-containing protein n=1 Tax=Chenopodium quinoa TaxID=63459 RepID=A0A803ME40_CHEQI
MATYMVESSSDSGCGFIGGLFQRRSLCSRRSSVRSLPSNTNSKNVTEKKDQGKPVEASAAVKCRPEKVVTEKSVTPTIKSNVASPRCSISHNHNQSRRLSDAARISTTSSSSSSANRIQERQPSGDQSEAGTPRAPSGNILQLAQINSLKQKCVTPNSNTIVNKTLEINNVTMGNILRRNSTDELRFQSSLSKLDPEELKSLGNDKYKQGKYEEALVLYDQAIAIDSSVAAYRSNKSAVLTALGRLLEAVFECREAVRIDPCYQRAHHRLAGIYIRLGYAEEAVQHFSLSGSIASIADITQAKALGKCLSRCNEAKELKDWGTLLRQTHDALAIGANSSLQKIYALQSQALLNLFRHDEAYAAFKRAPYFDMDLYTRLFGETKTTFLYLIKAQIYMSTGRFEDAITAAQTAAQLNPNDKEARKMVIRTRSVAVARSKGNKLFKELKLQEACSIYSEGLEYDPYNSVLLCNRAACRSKLGQFEKAMEDCTLALNLQPSYSKARLRRAHCNAKMERWEASIQDYEILIREKPGDEEVGRALFEAKVQLKKQRGEDVKDMKFGSDVVLVSSIECFRHLITSPGMSVVLFCSKSNQEKAVTLLEQVCLKFPSINFLKVEVEDHPYLVKSEEVTNIPAFKIYKNGTRVRDIPGNNLELLQNSIKLYSS